MIYIVVKISMYRLKQQNIHLEEVVRQRTTEINAKNIELSHQKDIIEKKNEDIISSINYASKIQQALFPSLELLQISVSEYFVLNKPRDIVSGDFYWVTQKNDKLIVCVADCTGHGVPGAFMSLLGIAFLNEILTEIDNIQPDIINNLLREKVITSLHQSEISVSKDGMDNSICIIDNTLKTILYSGAYNPLYHIRNSEITEYKADRMPIGYHINRTTPFTIKKIEYLDNDTIYMFSDGYADQFGGEEGKKFKYKQLKNILTDIQPLNMTMQKQALNDAIQTWMNFKFDEQNTYNQVDDILVMGIRL
jgi:serine phosphatase RsbU (regulator of sigma subunit)